MCVVLQKYAVHLTSCDVDCEDRGSYKTCLKIKKEVVLNLWGKVRKPKKQRLHVCVFNASVHERWIKSYRKDKQLCGEGFVQISCSSMFGLWNHHFYLSSVFYLNKKFFFFLLSFLYHWETTSSHLKTSWSSSALCILSYRWLNRCIFMVLQSCFNLFLLFCPPLSPTAEPFRHLWCRLAVLWHSWTPINLTLHTTCCSVRLIWF